jgi:hypothetical protein
MGDALDRAIAALREAADELRTGTLDPERAAAVVEDCARLAAEGAAELDREVRAGDAPGAAPGQMAFE